tara:strand:+ start:299 stop:571 length:273 start_codon:yes stop_codon:yes gene_type:complete
MKAIILAAGLGSRLARVTKNKPKSLIKIGNQTILKRLILQLESCGVKDINIICGYKKKKLTINFQAIKHFFIQIIIKQITYIHCIILENF